MMNSINNIEDEQVRDAVLGLLSDEQYWQQQQARQKPRYLSASLKQQDNHRNVCTRCGSVGHDAVICPFSVKNLLAPSS